MSIKYLSKLNQMQLLSIYDEMGFLRMTTTGNGKIGTEVTYGENFVTVHTWNHSSHLEANYIDAEVSFNDFEVFDNSARVKARFEQAMIRLIPLKDYRKYEEDKLNYLTTKIYEAHNKNLEAIRKLEVKNISLMAEIQNERVKSAQRFALKKALEDVPELKKKK